MAFDIIGVLGFGKSFDILSTGDTKMIDSVAKFVKLGAITSCIPFGNQIKWLLGDWVNAGRYVLAIINDTIEKRKQENSVSDSMGRKSSGNKHVDILQRLVNARDPFTGDFIDNESLRAEVLIMLLAAVIYEAMRLYPAVAGYMPRAVPERGAHVMGGNNETWTSPNDFDPERFMGPDSEERIKDIKIAG
ncbi:hypothetical protein EV178_005640 [Coemansia sp. RSA 1646]|nr:hypothetical protein EV178_005640 [Coemansia sp. RSA 1646]